MFHFERSIQVKTTSDMPAALEFAAQSAAYVNKCHSLNMKFGVELGGALRIHWYCDIESLDKFTKINASLLQDHHFLELIGNVKAVWVEGSLKDTFVTLVG